MGRTARVVLTLAVTYFLFRSLHVSWGQLGQQELSGWRPRLLPVVFSVAIMLSVFAYSSSLWAAMIRALGGPRLKLVTAVEIFFLANLGRYIPGKVWQLAGLAYLAGKQGVNGVVASSAAILGQIYSLGAAVIVALVGIGLSGAAGIGRDLAPFAIGMAALIGVAVTVPALVRFALDLAFRLTRTECARPEIDPWFGLRWLFLYFPMWLGYGLAFGLLWSAFPHLPPVAWALAIGSFAGAYFLGYAAVFAPAGIGIREGALAVLLAPTLGATPATVLAIVARIWNTLCELLPVVWAGSRNLLNRSRKDIAMEENGC
jgi:hypothetical protein